MRPRPPGCRSPHVSEDTSRFGLLALLILCFLLCGAALFSAIERPSELRARARWNRTLHNFSHAFNISVHELSAFLHQYQAAAAAGIRADALRPRWDFTGAFYFVATVMSTIGFGMTTPVTVAGKVFLIFYGLLGCAATILFFNLFLERIITLLAVVMKAFRLHRMRTSGLLPPGICQDFAASALPGWKPSVYHMMLILGLSAIIIACCASDMYSPVEGWAYLDSLYFCFVTFSTIGFGDLVLNWMLSKMSCVFCQRCNKSTAFLGRRNAIRPGSRFRRGHFSYVYDSEGSGENDRDGRRLSGEMISMRDLTSSNKISLAIMQKQLSDSANGYPRTVCGSSGLNGFSGGVGALGIMNNRLAETSDSR